MLYENLNKGIPVGEGKGKENLSYAGNVPYSGKRSKQIDEKLRCMVANMTHPLTQAEIAEGCGMSKQRVYQIEQRAFRKIAKYHAYLREELYGGEVF